MMLPRPDQVDVYVIAGGECVGKSWLRVDEQYSHAVRDNLSPPSQCRRGKKVKLSAARLVAPKTYAAP